MSRKMKDKEIEAFESRFGYKPVGVRVAIDALAIYVHKDNPIKSLTIPQIDAIFSSTRRCGYPEDIRTWGDLGLEGVVENSTDSTLWTQLGFRNLWVLQTGRDVFWRFQKYRQ